MQGGTADCLELFWMWVTLSLAADSSIHFSCVPKIVKARHRGHIPVVSNQAQQGKDMCTQI